MVIKKKFLGGGFSYCLSTQIRGNSLVLQGLDLTKFSFHTVSKTYCFRYLGEQSVLSAETPFEYTSPF